MSLSPSRFAGRLFGALWRALDAGRRAAMNLLFLLIVVVLVVGIVSSGPKQLDDKTALVLNFKGTLVEQHPGNASRIVLSQTTGDTAATTQLRDVLTVLDAAANDPNISCAVLMLDDMQAAGLPMLREVAAALDRFKASGKPVIAWGSLYDQRQYYLAAHANEILLHPMGLVMLNGLGSYRNYYREALDKLGITVNLMRVGTYKSFAEPYIANGPSPAAAEAESYVLGAMWETYTDGVEKARKLSKGSLTRLINDLPRQFAAVGGDAGKLLLSAKLVDGLKTPDEFRRMMIARGAEDEKSKSFRQVSFTDYLSRQKPRSDGDAVGVVVAMGDISDGDAPQGAIGGRSTSALIKRAREDKRIKAVVLRVNSGGGSALGSELIRREMELTRNAGKPVLVSMGNVAASGGYWISMAADEVIADAATITGSIGIFALLPTADKALAKIGVHNAGVGTTWLSGGYDPRRQLDPKLSELIQTVINRGYVLFITKAAAARKTTPEKINEVAQGRIWTGQQAKDRGLIDTVGSYGDALKSAAARAKLGDNFRVTYIEREPTKVERVLKLFDVTLAQALAEHFDLRLMPIGKPPAAMGDVANDLGWLAGMADGRNAFMAVAHCLCREPFQSGASPPLVSR